MPLSAAITRNIFKLSVLQDRAWAPESFPREPPAAPCRPPEPQRTEGHGLRRVKLELPRASGTRRALGGPGAQAVPGPGQWGPIEPSEKLEVTLWAEHGAAQGGSGQLERKAEVESGQHGRKWAHAKQ